MNVKTLPVGPLETNCHIVWGDARHALVIDPGDEAGAVLRCMEKHGLEAAAYIVTHGHMDHVSALAEVAEKKPAPVGIHKADADWAFSAGNQMPPIYGIPRRPAEISRLLEDGGEWDDIGRRYRVIATPGHSPGGVCLYFPDDHILFSGDTLFMGSIGRTDLPGSDGRELAQSLRKLACLPGETIVYPGHGPATRMDAELRTNPFLQT